MEKYSFLGFLHVQDLLSRTVCMCVARWRRRDLRGREIMEKGYVYTKINAILVIYIDK